MLVGEEMSKLVKMDRLIYSGSEIYEDYVHWVSHAPLDVGRLAYAKMRGGLSADIPVEVIWNHFRKEVTMIVAAGRQNEYSYTFKEKIMARVDLIIFIDQLVIEAQEAEPWLRQLQS